MRPENMSYFLFLFLKNISQYILCLIHRYCLTKSFQIINAFGIVSYYFLGIMVKKEYIPWEDIYLIYLDIWRKLFFLTRSMAAHSSVLAWRIPWTEEPGRLQSIGSHRVGHDWVTNTLLLPFFFLFVTNSVLIYALE